MSQDIVLNGIISYPKLFEAQQINGQGDPKFTCRLILDPTTDWNAVNACVQEAIRVKWPQGAPANLAMPFHDARDDGFAGQYYLNASSNAESPPQVVDQNVNPVLDRSKLFAGCRVACYLRFAGYDNLGKGVGVYVNAVQIIDNVNVTRLDKRVDAKAVFKPIPGAPAPLAPTAYPQPQGAPPAPFGGSQVPAAPPPVTAPVAPPGPPVGAPPAAGYPSSPMPWQQ